MSQPNQIQCGNCGQPITVTAKKSSSAVCPICRAITVISQAKEFSPTLSEPTKPTEQGSLITGQTSTKNPAQSARSFSGIVKLGDLVATETALKSIRKAKNFLLYMAAITFLACGVALLEMCRVILEIVDLMDEGIAPAIAFFRVLMILIIIAITFFQGMYLLRSSRSAAEATPACSSTVIEQVMLYQFKFWRMTVIAIGIAGLYAIIVEQTDSAIKKAKHIKKWEGHWD